LVAISAEQRAGGGLHRAEEPERRGACHDRGRQPPKDRRLKRLRRSCGGDIDAWLPFSHIVLSNFKRWAPDIFHGVSPAHLQAYLDE
jgi:hypothetical protein